MRPLDSQLLAFLIFTVALVLTPGATTAVIVRTVVEHGRGAGLATAAGALVANGTHAAAAGLGVAALLAQLPGALSVVRIGGALYLLALGVQSLGRAWRVSWTPAVLDAATDGRAGHDGAFGLGFSRGLVTNLLNPAIAIFYLVAVPSFLPAAGPRLARFALFALIHVTLAFSYHTLWVWALDALRAAWSNRTGRRVVELATGVALCGLALRLALS